MLDGWGLCQFLVISAAHPRLSSPLVMTFSDDLRWRAVILFNFLPIPIETVSALLDVSPDSIRKWSRKPVFIALPMIVSGSCS